MRTSVREAYSGDDVRSMALLPVVALVDRLRAGGAPISTGEVVDAVTAVAAVGLSDRTVLAGALRGALVKDRMHLDLFDRCFAATFPALRPRPRDRGDGRPAADDERSGAHGDDDGGPGREPGAREGGGAGDGTDLADRISAALRGGDRDGLTLALDEAVERWAGTDEGRSTEHHLQRVLRRMDLWRLYRLLLEAGPDDGADEDDGASPMERALRAARAGAQLEELRRLIAELVEARLREGHPPPPRAPTTRGQEGIEDVDLLRAGPDQIAALRAAVRPLARRLAARLGRRARRQATGSLDMRRTIRRSMSYGGVPMQPALRRRRPSRPDVVVICDVSGSTAQFAPFMLGLMHAVHQEFRHVRSFVFVDGVVEVSDLLEAAPGVLDPRHLLDRRGLVARDGRSDYALALSTFLQRWPDVVTPRTSVLIAGDARSHDREPALAQTAALARAARRLYWLNPEPRAEWDTSDSALGLYATHCTDVFEVATLRQLADAVAKIA